MKNNNLLTLLIIAYVIVTFPNFLKGLDYLKKDLTFVYCSVTKLCK